jgi:hypothetical protein
VGIERGSQLIRVQAGAHLCSQKNVERPGDLVETGEGQSVYVSRRIGRFRCYYEGIRRESDA